MNEEIYVNLCRGLKEILQSPKGKKNQKERKKNPNPEKLIH